MFDIGKKQIENKGNINMNKKDIKHRFLNITTLKIAGVISIFLLAFLLLWYGNATSSQADLAMVAQVYFDGEYRILDGEWQKIEEGKHIPATEGDVTLRGNFHMCAPDGNYVGIYSGDLPIAFYTNHINLTFYEDGNEPYVIDAENPMYGKSACGVVWTAHAVTSEEPIEILIHNPHSFGNETAIDELLSNIALWNGIEFEKGVLEREELQRDIGLMCVIVSLLFLGSALFSALIHIKNSEILWKIGVVILFAGSYIIYSLDSIPFRSESIVTNTTLLGCSKIFYMLFLLLVLVHFLKGTKKIGSITVVALGIFDAILFVLSTVTNMLFYDTWFYWVVAQTIANIIMLGCHIRELFVTTGKERWLHIGSILLLVSFSIDVVMIKLGLWNSGIVSTYAFYVFFMVVIVLALRIIPNSINAVAKAKELETEKIILNAKLTESRVSTMMSQIRPHFIYNTLGSIEQLCTIDPKKARELVHNFAKYLRGNLRELDNPRPILMSQEMEHVHHYISIENVRFPDMTFSFEMNAGDFYIPALTIQPIVENAIKHGLMKLQKGGTIRMMSYETDTHYYVSVEDNGAGFDTNVLIDERKHVGLRNIRGRLEAMVNGTLSIESTEGVGTKVLISIPKEVEK